MLCENLIYYQSHKRCHQKKKKNKQNDGVMGGVEYVENEIISSNI